MMKELRFLSWELSANLEWLRAPTQLDLFGHPATAAESYNFQEE